MEWEQDELASIEEAREIAKKMVTVGGGVKPESQDPEKSGIYRLDWYGGGAGFQEPQGTNAKGEKTYQLAFRLNNGAVGMNVGLVREMFRRYPTSAIYWLRREAIMLAGGPAY